MLQKGAFNEISERNEELEELLSAQKMAGENMLMGLDCHCSSERGALRRCRMARFLLLHKFILLVIWSRRGTAQFSEAY